MASRYVVDPAGIPAARTGDAQETVRETLTAEFGSPGLVQSIISASGAGQNHDTGGAEQVLFVVSGSGSIVAAGQTLDLVPHCGVYLPPGCPYRVSAAGGSQPIEIVRVGVDAPTGHQPSPGTVHVQRIEDCDSGAATGGRDFQVLADASSGFASGTLFVGNVPAGPPAPTHYHTYDEVIYVLEGEGVLHIDGERNVVGPGSCYRLPARVVHQVENSAPTTFREVGVFVPSGSPAVAFLPDGTSAYPGLPDDYASDRR